MENTHHTSSSTCEVPNSARQAGRFSKVSHSLKLAYSWHLKASLTDQRNDANSIPVRNNVALIIKKLRHLFDADAAQLGEAIVNMMLTRYRNEFRFMACAETLNNTQER